MKVFKDAEADTTAEVVQLEAAAERARQAAREAQNALQQAKNQKRKGKQLDPSIKAPNTLVYDKLNGWALEYVESPEGRQKLFEGQYVFCMVRKWTQKNGEMTSELEPLPEPDRMKASPRMLYWGLKGFEPITPVAFGKASDAMKTVKLVLLVVVAGLAIFGIFLIMGG